MTAVLEVTRPDDGSAGRLASGTGGEGLHAVMLDDTDERVLAMLGLGL